MLVLCACCAPRVASKRTRYHVPKIFISSYLYLHYKFRSSTVTDKQSVSLNIMPVHLSDFVDFVNMFIRYRSRHHTSELSVMATKMVSTTFFSL